jgi:hypothetical protein
MPDCNNPTFYPVILSSVGGECVFTEYDLSTSLYDRIWREVEDWAWACGGKSLGTPTGGGPPTTFTPNNIVPNDSTPQSVTVVYLGTCTTYESGNGTTTTNLNQEGGLQHFLNVTGTNNIGSISIEGTVQQSAIPFVLNATVSSIGSGTIGGDTVVSCGLSGVTATCSTWPATGTYLNTKLKALPMSPGGGGGYTDVGDYVYQKPDSGSGNYIVPQSIGTCGVVIAPPTSHATYDILVYQPGNQNTDNALFYVNSTDELTYIKSLKITSAGDDPDVSEKRLTNVGYPTASGDAANKEYVDQVTSGVSGNYVLRDGTTSITGRQDFEDGLNVSSYIQFSATSPTHEEGRVYWDEDDKTLSIMTDQNGVTLQVGQEFYLRGVNKSGGTIGDGSAVYVSGAQGQRPAFHLATASGTENLQHDVVGIATHSIGNNQNGIVTTLGIVRDLDTSPYSAGDELWLGDILGSWSTTKPDKNHVFIGWVLYSHATEGKVFVFPDVGQHFEDLHDMFLTSPADNQLIEYDSSVSGWVNTSTVYLNSVSATTVSATDVTIANDLDVSGDILTNGRITATSGAVSAPGYSFYNDSDTGISRTAANEMTFATAGTAAMVVNSGQNVGIGTSTPLSQLNVDGGTGSIATGITLGDGDTGIYEIVDDLLAISVGSNIAGYIDSAGKWRIGTASSSATLNVGGDRQLYFEGGAAGIRTTSGNLSILANNDATNYLVMTGTEFRFGGSNGGGAVGVKQVNTNQPAIRLDQMTSGTESLLDVYNVAGVKTMGVTLTGLTTAGTWPGNGVVRIAVEHTVAGTSSDGDGVGIALKTENISGVITDVAYIDAVYDDISDDDVSLRLSVRNSGTPSEVLRIDGEHGNVGIGTTSPDSTALLEVNSTTQGFLPPVMTQTQRTDISSPATGLMVYDTTNRNMYFYTGSSWVAMS